MYFSFQMINVLLQIELKKKSHNNDPKSFQNQLRLLITIQLLVRNYLFSINYQVMLRACLFIECTLIKRILN